MKKIFKILICLFCIFAVYKVNASVLTNVDNVNFASESMSCYDLLGHNLVRVLHLFISAVRIIGVIITIISAMLAFIPAITSDNADALKKAFKKSIWLLVILIAIALLPTIIGVIGRIAGFDLTCL